MTKPALKRRLSLADELSLAMVGEDSESGYHDETSEMASSASEMEESEVESSINGLQDESEYSANGESAGEESTYDSGDSEDRTLDALHPAIGANRPRSRLPRYQQPRR